ncbi:MAG: hypothetical protein K6G85_09410 [Eubacterium sp.]|nr:hypothetical protein [Eubacterium sp.]
MSRKKVIITVIIGLVITLLILFFSSYRTSLKYNDWLVVGHSVKEVEKRYGKFDIVWEHRKAYKLNDGNQMIMPSHLPEYYWMVIDEDGIVIRVYVESKPGG